MGLVRTFLGYRPGARIDGRPWTQALIREAPDVDGAPGAWVTIDTLPLDPLDTDPTDPDLRDFTTEEAALATGWYWIVFVDADGDEDYTVPVRYPPVASLRPSIAEIAALEHSRTSARGEEQGTFNASTQPTGVAVDLLITQAIGDTRNDVGVGIPDKYIPDARSLVVLRTAALIESSYFAREVDTDRSAYRQHTAAYLNGVQNLAKRIPQALTLN